MLLTEYLTLLMDSLCVLFGNRSEHDVILLKVLRIQSLDKMF